MNGYNSARREDYQEKINALLQAMIEPEEGDTKADQECKLRLALYAKRMIENPDEVTGEFKK